MSNWRKKRDQMMVMILIMLLIYDNVDDAVDDNVLKSFLTIWAFQVIVWVLSELKCLLADQMIMGFISGKKSFSLSNNCMGFIIGKMSSSSPDDCTDWGAVPASTCLSFPVRSAPFSWIGVSLRLLPDEQPRSDDGVLEYYDDLYKAKEKGI